MKTLLKSSLVVGTLADICFPYNKAGANSTPPPIKKTLTAALTAAVSTVKIKPGETLYVSIRIDKDSIKALFEDNIPFANNSLAENAATLTLTKLNKPLKNNHIKQYLFFKSKI